MTLQACCCIVFDRRGGCCELSILRQIVRLIVRVWCINRRRHSLCLCSLRHTEVIDALQQVRHLFVRISEVRGAGASTRCEDAVTRSESAANFFALNPKTIDSVHSRARLNGSNGHIRTQILNEGKSIDTSYQKLVGSRTNANGDGFTMHRWLSNDLHIDDWAEH